MPDPAKLTILLPPRRRLAGPLPRGLASILGRADHLPESDPGERAQLLRCFDLLPRGWPIAALTRQADVGDATGATWLRADPAWVRPDINGVRLLACGDMLRLSREDVDALLPALRPIFGDAGFLLDAPVPERWYLHLPREAKVPVFADPVDALGCDLFEYLPQDDAGQPGVARRWRTLLSEAQVVLHNHPWNARRAAAGKPPVNALWPWGAGTLPDRVTCRQSAVQSEDPTLLALAKASAATVSPLPSRFSMAQGSTLIDRRMADDLPSLANDWLLPAIHALQRGTIARIDLDFADGARMALQRGQRWRFWRKPLAVLDRPAPGST